MRRVKFLTGHAAENAFFQFFIKVSLRYKLCNLLAIGTWVCVAAGLVAHRSNRELARNAIGGLFEQLRVKVYLVLRFASKALIVFRAYTIHICVVTRKRSSFAAEQLHVSLLRLDSRLCLGLSKVLLPIAVVLTSEVALQSHVVDVALETLGSVQVANTIGCARPLVPWIGS